MTRLSIRSRLTLWYTVVLLIVLVLAGLAVTTLHARLGLSRVDGELAGALESARGVIRHEIDERLALKDAARDMLDELSLPGIGVAVLDDSGTILVSTTPRPPRLSDHDIRSATMAADYSGDGMRRIAGGEHYGNFTYRLVVWRSIESLTLEARTLRDAILLGVPVVILLAGLGGWMIASNSLRPIADLATQADAIEHGLDETQLRVPNPADEIGVFAGAFNRLLTRFGSLLRAQRAFMADASHQLRTPVSVIRTSAQVTLSRTDRSADEYRESLEIVERQSTRLTKMVDDMFMLAMVDVEARPLQSAPLYVNEVVESVARDARSLASGRNITLISATAEDISLTGDEDLLRQMLWNLVENALRYGRSGGTINLSVDRSDDAVEITVEDDGPGISAADRLRVFDRFVRLETAGGAAGAGLGLPIARWIAQAHRGSLALDDTSRGCRFRIILPTTN